ncbi:hypothetical protein TNCT_178681 [Trichonephila clavata]|uniref:Uncharacterized protein n=1 Tax=Trichonephila clavata TaxID=2740835 RepID=A0A8X6EYS0_TRICU|nr:hypothetical protein TNCT_178681 [Trichonephila clavata]
MSQYSDYGIINFGTIKKVLTEQMICSVMGCPRLDVVEARGDRYVVVPMHREHGMKFLPAAFTVRTPYLARDEQHQCFHPLPATIGRNGPSRLFVACLACVQSEY